VPMHSPERVIATHRTAGRTSPRFPAAFPPSFAWPAAHVSAPAQAAGKREVGSSLLAPFCTRVKSAWRRDLCSPTPRPRCSP
jgi:hypothetical protein